MQLKLSETVTPYKGKDNQVDNLVNILDFSILNHLLFHL